MDKINFTKMSGAGNDFIVIDKDIHSGILLSKSIISKLCNRRNGIGADGLITIENSDESDFKMTYYNADGAAGTLCGNGARCAIFFAELSGRVKGNKTNFLANKEKYSGEVLGDEKVKFLLNPPKNLKLNFPINAAGKVISSNFVDTGSPHVVINISDILKEPDLFYDNLNEFPVYELGREIRYHQEFAPEGTNVNFIQIENKKINIRTFERGVEDETLACGTGSAAAALISYFNYNIQPPIYLQAYSGEELIVDFSFEQQQVKSLSLTGPAKVVYTGEFNVNRFL